MALFLSDLDNTLIYSYKRDIGNDKILVEEKDGKELSFMTQYAVKCLKELQIKLSFIPLTTRSVQQYKRITFPEAIHPHYALAANGGILLVDGEIDKQWFLDTQKLIESVYEEMDKGRGLLCADSDVYFPVDYVDSLFVFTKSKNPVLTISKLCKKLDLEQVSIHENGEKVYILPRALHKGLAAERIKWKFGAEKIISAGDSIFDIPMLTAADIGYYPHSLHNAIHSLNMEAQIPCGVLEKISCQVFSDGLLSHLQKQMLMEE